MKIYLIHGFNVSDGGERTTDQLIEPLTLAGHEVVELDYGHWHRLRVRLANKPLSKIIAAMAEPDSVLIGHSNGGCLAQMAAMAGAKIKRMVLINPALNSDIVMPANIRCDIYYSPHDRVVELSRWIPWSPWGNMGRVGSTLGGINHDLEQITGTRVGHSTALSDSRFQDHLVGLLGPG